MGPSGAGEGKGGPSGLSVVFKRSPIGVLRRELWEVRIICTYYVVHVCITWSTNYDCSVTLSVRVQYMRIQCTCMIMWSYLLNVINKL